MVQQQALSLSLTLCLFFCLHVCTRVLYQCFLIVSSPSAWLCLPLSVDLLWDQLLVFRVRLDQFQQTHTLTHKQTLPIQHPSHPFTDPSSSHAASQNSMALSASLLRSPSQQWPRASREQHSHPPLLTAALCQATCLARVGRGVARRLDNNFCQWNGVRIRLGTQTREVCPGLVLQLAGVLGYRQASCLAVSPHLSEEAGLPLNSALMGKKVQAPFRTTMTCP